MRGVTTNKSFLLHVLDNDEFLDGYVDTGFIAANPQLLAPLTEQDRAQKLLQYIGEVIVNGKNLHFHEKSFGGRSTCSSSRNVLFLLGTPKALGATGGPPS